MSTIIRFALETALLNVVAWVLGAILGWGLLGPFLRRRSAGWVIRWLAYSAIAALAGLVSYLAFDASGRAIGATELIIAWLSMFIAAAAVVGAAMLVTTVAKKPA